MDISNRVKKLWDEGRVREIRGNMIIIPELEEVRRGNDSEFNWLIAKNVEFECVNYLVLFAEPKYTDDFLKSKVRPFGYKTTFPGGVSILHYREGNEVWSILGMQNLYKLKTMDETLAMRYCYSRRTLLEYFFEKASDKNANYIEYKIYLCDVHTPAAKQDKIISVGKRYGYFFLQLEKPDESQIQVLVLEKRQS